MIEETAPEEPVPFMNARYQDLGAFARGGYSVIHLVREHGLDRSVAMKVMQEGIREQVDARERFCKEARITAQLDHPGIVPIHELGPWWFTMKRIEGWTYRSFVRGNTWGAAALSEAMEVLQKICDTLAFAHDRRVIHCDPKPENVMIGRFRQVYVMDWGIARQLQEVDPTTAGTPGWMAPEQARGEACDVRTDVYGVGALLYYTLCGGRPHEAPDSRGRLALARIGKIRPPAEVAPGRKMPPELVRIALKALDPDPARRYASIPELQADLRAAHSQGWWFETRHIPRGTRIIREGDTGDFAYLLIRGRCEILRGGAIVGGLRPGEVVGEAALLTDSPRSATVVAPTELVVRVITRAALLEERARSDWMGALVRSLARRFQEVTTGEVDLTFRE